jgi:hypothetical protein
MVYLKRGVLAALIGKRVKIAANKPGENWIYAGKTGRFLGADVRFPMDVVVELDSTGLHVYCSPSDIEEVLN